MSKKMTKGQLIALLEERISQELTKTVLTQTKAELEKLLEDFDSHDFYFGGAEDAARADIEKEFGQGSFHSLGDKENTGDFIRGLETASEDDVDLHASHLKAQYSTFNETVADHFSKDPELDSMRQEDPHEFLNAMGTTMYQYMMDNNSASPFIVAIQEWITDIEFSPDENEPINPKMYNMLSGLEQSYNNRHVGKARRNALNEEKAELERMLNEEFREMHYSIVFLQGDDAEEAMEILDQQGNDAAMQHLLQWYEGDGELHPSEDGGPVRGTQDHEFRKVIDGDTFIMNWNTGIPYIGLSMMKMKEVLPKQNYDDLYDGVTEAGIKGKTALFEPMMRGEHDPKQTYDWRVMFIDKMNGEIDLPYSSKFSNVVIKNKSYAEALRDAKAMIPQVDGAVGVDLEEKPRTIKYEYNINLDERGSFYADVRDDDGKTVFEIRAGNELGEDETSIFEDGYMKHKKDLQGLEKYLKQLGIMEPEAKLVSAYAEGTMNEDRDEMDVDGGELSDDMNSMEMAMDVDRGYYVVPPTAEDQFWYVVNQDNDPVQGYNTEEEAKAALAQMEPSGSSGYGTDFKENRILRMESLLSEMEILLREYQETGYADMDRNAPWNAEEIEPLVGSVGGSFRLVDSNAQHVIVQDGTSQYVFDLDALTPEEVGEIAINHVGVPSSVEQDEDGMSTSYDTSDYVHGGQLHPENVVDYINANIPSMKIGHGTEAWEDGAYDLVALDEPMRMSLAAQGLNV